MAKLAILYQQVIPLIPSLKKGYFNPLECFDEILFVTFDRGLSQDQIEAIGFAFGKARLKVVPIGGVNFHNLLAAKRKVGRILAKFRPDVIRAYSSQVDGYLAVTLAKRLGIPSVISLHGDRDRDNRYNMLAEKKYYHYTVSILHKSAFEKKALRQCTHIMAAYEFAADYGRRYSERPITVIYNRVDTDVFHPAEKKPNEFTIINIGRMIPAKKQDVLIRAMKEVDGVLVLVGNGSSLAQFEHLAENTGVARKVRFVKSLSHADVPQVLRNAHVYATAINYGGIAIPVMEAMASGLPVVQCKPPFEEAPELVADAGLIVEPTPEAFAAGINKLKADRELYMKMSESARQIMREHSAARMDALEAEVYRSALSRKDNS